MTIITVCCFDFYKTHIINQVFIQVSHPTEYTNHCEIILYNDKKTNSKTFIKIYTALVSNWLL